MPTFRGACRSARTATSTRYTLREELPEERYIDTLLRDLDAQAGPSAGAAAHQHFSRWRHAQPVFAGGDRPAARARRARLGFIEAIEITLEANPGTIERGRFAEYRAAGMTRVSLGAQSFDRAPTEAARPDSFRRRDAPRRRGAARRRPREFQSRSDVRAAGTDGRRRARRTCARRSHSRPRTSRNTT